ncbi:MAG TPA: hypothetical protein VKE88_00240 [Candidatus Nanoarchaeia archaeon]|nr:hypothetical protein [Candidatus Nanoarchaeia archaeon]
MVQEKILIGDLEISYDGLFDSGDFFKLLDEWFKQNGYDKNELKHIERVREKGKFIDYEILPFKKLTDYAKSKINVRVIINDLTNVTIKKDKQHVSLNKGKITILISAFLSTDITEQWEAKPIYFFFRTIWDKYINKSYTDKYEIMIMNDVQALHTELKAYFNLIRQTTPS